MGFFQKLARAVERNESLLCVGLDPDLERLPAGLPAGQAGAKDVAAFQRAIIEATSDLVCAYKPNLAFYEALGEPGLEALHATLAADPSLAKAWALKEGLRALHQSPEAAAAEAALAAWLPGGGGQRAGALPARGWNAQEMVCGGAELLAVCDHQRDGGGQAQPGEGAQTAGLRPSERPELYAKDP